MTRHQQSIKRGFRMRHRRTGKVEDISADRAHELFIGGICGVWSLAIQFGMSIKVSEACQLVLKAGVEAATPEALATVYGKLLGDKYLPTSASLLLAANAPGVSRETPRGNSRRKSPQKPATPRRARP
jgi:hypothetical protein